ncbi:MAG: type II 3-dehydroquinate dehydratase [Pseudomonadota bacterium]
MAIILTLHGPNLNLLGVREPEQYGNETLGSIDTRLFDLANQLGHSLSSLQSNSEAELTNQLHATTADFIIFNPAAFTHTSIVLRDALLAIAKPFVEVHISNIFRRESFRQHSYFSDIAIGTINGLGAEGYLLALRYAHIYLSGVNNVLWTCEKSAN